MSSTALETLRAACENIEYLGKAGSAACAERSIHVGTAARKVALWDRRIRYLAAEQLRQATRALDLLADSDGLQAREVNEFSGRKHAVEAARRGGPVPPPPPGSTEPPSRDVWRAFYERLRGVEDSHRSATAASGVDGALAGAAEQKNEAIFVLEAIEATPNFQSIYLPGEERGKILDLTQAYDNYCNWRKYKQHRERSHRVAVISRLKRSMLDRAKKRGEATDETPLDDFAVNLDDPQVAKKLQFMEIDYVRFLRSAPHELENVPRFCKYRDPDYERYTSQLADYLEDYLSRTRPLNDLRRQRRKLEQQFEEAWKNKRLPAWALHTVEFEDTYAPATDRLFATPVAKDGHVKGKQYVKANESWNADTAAKNREASIAKDKEYALREFLIQQYLEKLESILEATIQHICKKQSRTLEELRREAASDEEEENMAQMKFGEAAGAGGMAAEANAMSDEEGSEDEAARRIRNPLNLPLGWDGKPIPYWLYKLHGLGQEFKCEICGNHSYWGRRVFERHFQEWRHAFGMKCLKIPNTLHFKEITKIDDAIALYEKLKVQTEAKTFLPDQDIEVEDTDGNVMTPQTYEDLRRQGLL